MLAFVPPALFFKLGRRPLEKLFASYSVDFPIPEGASSLATIRALWGVPVSPELEAALYALADLLRPEWERTLGQALEEMPKSASGKSAGPPEGVTGGAALAWLLRRREGTSGFERLRRRVYLRIDRQAPPPSRYIRVGAARKFPRSVEDSLARFALEEKPWALLHGRDERGALRVALVREDTPNRVAYAAGAREEEKRIRVAKRLVTDLVTLDETTGEVVVEAEEPAHAPSLLRAVATAFFDDPAHFKDTPAFSLKPLTLKGSAGLLALRLPDGVIRIRVIEIGWSDGLEAYHTAKGSNALATYESYGGPASGYISRVVFRIDVRGEERPVDVTFQLPYQIGMRRLEYAPLVHRALASFGIFSPGAIPDDLWWLSPWIHPPWRWTAIVGADGYESLLAAGILNLVKTRLVGSKGSRRLGWSYIAFDLKGERGQSYAVSEDPTLPPRTVEESDTVMASLDLQALRRRLAAQLLLEPSRTPVTDPSILDLGVRRTDTGTIHLFLALRSPTVREAAEVRGAMRRASHGETAVVLVPEGRSFGGGFFEVPLPAREMLGVDSSLASVYGAISKEFGTEGFIEPWQLAKNGVRFVLEASTSRAWFDGVPISFNESEWAFVWAIARGGAHGVETRVIEQKVFKNFSSGMARNVALKVRERVREAYAEAERRLPSDAEQLLEFLNKRRWRIAVAFEVR